MTSRNDLVAFSRKTRHDLQNPVAAVTLALELAQDELESGGDDVVELVGRALRSAERLSEALDTLPDRAADWPLEG